MGIRIALGILAALANAGGAFGQAAAEYALQSSRGALSASGSGSFGGCSVDSRLLECLTRSYPKATIVVVAVLALLILRWLTRGRAVQR